MSKFIVSRDKTYRGLLHAGALASALTAGVVVQTPAHAADDTALEEIIVTATRREERNQDVPIAITAFTPERLQQQNITTSQDLNGLVPSLTVGSVGQGSRDSQTFTMRGQGATFQSSPGVVVYFNEVPLPAPITLSQQGGPGNYLDLENLQVLAGPQGTLFGRNTTGGAVLLVPHKPTNEFGGYGQITGGNYSNKQVEGVLNVPVISDTLMVRLAASYQDRDGYTHDVTFNKDRDNVHNYTGRLGILFRSDPIENYLMGYWAYSHTNGTGLIAKGFNIEGLKGITFCSDNPADIPGPNFITAPCDTYRNAIKNADALGPRATALSIDEYQTTRTWGVMNTTRFQVTDELALRNIVSYQKFVSNYLYDGDGTLLQQNDTGIPAGYLAPGYVNGTPANFPRDDIKDFTEELQLQGNLFNSDLVFTVGGFYYDQKPDGINMGSSANYCPANFTGFCPANLNFSGVHNRSKALYAQGTLDFGLFTDALRNLKLTTGYRYTWDQIDGFDQQYTPQAPPAPAGTVKCSSTNLTTTDPADCYFSAQLRSQAPTWIIGLDYKITDDLLVYVKESHGYKAGGFNPFSVRPETRTFTPEFVTSKEIGIKSDWHIGSVPLRVNADYYHTDYKDAQRASGDANLATGGVGAITLQSQAIIQGYELEAAIKPIPQLEIGGNWSYTDGRYKDFNWNTLAPVVDCTGRTIPAFGIANSDCLPFQYVSPHMYTVHATYTQSLPGTLGNVVFFVNYAHSSAQYTEAKYIPAEQPGATLEAFGLVNASIDWNNVAGSGVDVGLYATNLTDKLYRISNTDVYPAGVLLDWATIYGEPRMWGARVRYNFGGK